MIRRVLVTVLAATVVGLAAVVVYFALNEDSSSAPEIDDFVGTYRSGLIPAASSPGRVVTLTLRDNGSAALASDFQNNEPPVLQEGDWRRVDTQTVSITLTSGGGRPFTSPVTISFAREGNTLRNVGSVDLFGSAGLALTKQ